MLLRMNDFPNQFKETDFGHINPPGFLSLEAIIKLAANLKTKNGLNSLEDCASQNFNIMNILQDRDGAIFDGSERDFEDAIRGLLSTASIAIAISNNNACVISDQDIIDPPNRKALLQKPELEDFSYFRHLMPTEEISQEADRFWMPNMLLDKDLYLTLPDSLTHDQLTEAMLGYASHLRTDCIRESIQRLEKSFYEDGLCNELHFMGMRATVEQILDFWKQPEIFQYLAPAKDNLLNFN
jgi:hypothetical protein